MKKHWKVSELKGKIGENKENRGTFAINRISIFHRVFLSLM
ncbi:MULTISPECIES: hypothetical protein [unclassified Clostridium]